MFDMSYMGAWYPMVILVISLMYIMVIYIMAKKGYTSIAIGLTIVGTIFVLFGPVKIDGTNSKRNHLETSKQRTVEYIEVQKEAVVIKTTKPTFEERMQMETLRSEKANKVVKDEIVNSKD
jgi:hypothetical protein